MLSVSFQCCPCVSSVARNQGMAVEYNTNDFGIIFVYFENPVAGIYESININSNRSELPRFRANSERT